ncbi:MAG: hypothetical protein GY711_14200 [bacterium]|nr:hypothetical protein [bacterium]
MTVTDSNPKHTRAALLVVGLSYLALACAISSEAVPQQGWWAERGPVVPHDAFPADCSICHEGADWRRIRADFEFDHELETGAPLEGAHESAECLRCHNDRGPVAVFARRGCAGCHEDVHRTQLGQNCETCHDQQNWHPSEQIAIHNRTRFPLVGAHASSPCWRCHAGAQIGNFDRTDTECIRCHADDLARATTPAHLAQGWVDGCDRCHIPTTWAGAGFNHAWPLTGQHAGALCTACHLGGVYAGTPNQCVDCHLPEYQGTTSPNHASNSFPTQCQDCHGTSTWFGASFVHIGITGNCVSCHLAEYNGTTNPNHTAGGFSTTCENCHSSTTTWYGASFVHVGITGNCVSCHQSEYNNTTAPNHQAANFPTTCESCHFSTNTWFGATFSHQFPIGSGKHKNLSCTDCHLNPTNYQQFSCTHCHEHNQQDMWDEHKSEPGYAWTSAACYSCHPNGQAP